MSKIILPCPGINEPESLTPASRLIIDSVRSPKIDPKKFRNPKAIALKTNQEKVSFTLTNSKITNDAYSHKNNMYSKKKYIFHLSFMLIQAVIMKDVTKNLAIIFEEQRRSHSLFY